MKTLISTFFGMHIFLALIPAYGQDVLAYTAELPSPVPANTPFSITVTSRGACTYPYPQNTQAPDFELVGNQLNMTVYLRFFGQNIVPTPPCVSRTQVYTAPALQTGVYQIKLFSRYYLDIFDVFGERRRQGDFTFEVASAVPVTQIPATSGWSIALLLLGIMGLARWVSGQSGR
jgi:hypothetical protein